MEEAREEEIKDYTDLDKYAFVTVRAFENNHIGFCYRDWSDIKINSGWRFLFGDEDEDYLDNPENSLTKDLKEILEWKPQTGEILLAKRGEDFEWNEEINKFEKI